MSPGSPQSAYGMNITGLPRLAELVPATGGGPTVAIRIDTDRPPPPERPLDHASGVRLLADGRTLALDRARGEATFYGPPLAPDLIAHPYLAPVATTVNRWAGREAFHAGAFVADGRAWAVLGPRTAGKSTLMAALAARGTTVLSDDIVVSDGRVAFPGPRCIDLREPPPIPGLDLRLARRETRQRMLLGDDPAPVTLGGWVFLAWGHQLSCAPRSPAALLSDLATRRSYRFLASDPKLVLALTTLPAWTLTRPAAWSELAAGLDLLEATVTAAPWPTALSPAGPTGGAP